MLLAPQDIDNIYGTISKKGTEKLTAAYNVAQSDILLVYDDQNYELIY